MRRCRLWATKAGPRSPICKPAFVQRLHMVEDEAAGQRLSLRILEQLLVEVLLTLRLVGEDVPEVVKEGQALRWDDHCRPHRLPVVMSTCSLKDAAFRRAAPGDDRVIINVGAWVGDRVLAAEFLDLRVGLQKHNRAVEQDDNEKVNVDRHFECGDVFVIILL